MVMQTRTKFTSQLEDIKDLLVRLKEKCSADIIASALAAKGDEGAKEGVAAGRKDEDRLRSAIEESCLDAMLLQQPLIGDDMRFVTGAFRIVSDLSHIDSMTRDIVYHAEELPEKASNKIVDEVAVLSELTSKMVSDAVDAFLNSDVELAQKVIEADTKVNSVYWELHDKLVQLIRDGKSSAQYMPETLMVAKYFERIGDLSKRVASWAIYRVTGEHNVEEKPSQAAGLE